MSKTLALSTPSISQRTAQFLYFVAATTGWVTIIFGVLDNAVLKNYGDYGHLVLWGFIVTVCAGLVGALIEHFS